MADDSINVFFSTLGVDPASLSGGGGGASAAPEKGGGVFGKKVANELQKGNKGQKKGLGATLGIKFGVASLLKQSQVFTGFVGTIFQLMGALVDVILAPFLPILLPGIMLIAKMVPYVAKYAQMLYDFIDRTIFQWFRNLPISDKIKDGVTQALSAILVGVVFLKFTGLWNVFKSLVNTFIGRPMWGLLTKMFPQIDTLMAKFAGKSFGEIVQIAGKAAIKAIVGPWWDTLLLKLMYFVDFLAAPFKALWGVLRSPAQRLMGATLDDLVRRVWTNGLKSGLVTPLLTRLTGIAEFIAAPFAKMWGSISKNVATTGDGFISRGLTALKELPFVKAIVSIPQHLTELFNWIPKMIKGLPIVALLEKWLGKELMGKLGKFAKLAGKGFTALKGAATRVGGKALDVAAPAAATMLGKLKPSMLLKAAQGFKAIPVLGAIAELGFGGWATYKDYKKYGAKAALGRAALTLANTTTALFDPTGLASAAGSIGSNVAMDIAYKKMLDPKDSWKRDNPDIWVQQTDDFTGLQYWEKRQAADQNVAKHKKVGDGARQVTMDDVFGDR